MKPNRVGQRFWVPHSSHCVTISALPAPPHFSCQEGQQKAGGWGDEGGWAKNLLTDCFTHWLTRALSAEADWKACQLTTNRYLFFNLEKPSLLQIGEKIVLVPLQFFKSEKALPGFPCVAGRGTFGRYQHNEVVMGRQKRAPRIEGQVPWYANDAKSGPAGWRPQ